MIRIEEPVVVVSEPQFRALLNMYAESLSRIQQVAHEEMVRLTSHARRMIMNDEAKRKT
jgi:hypothetical protein